MIAVIGGGIAGLVAAFDLHRSGHRVQVFEASDRAGGKIWSSPVGDRLVDAGPDTFLARVPEGRQLCEDLGLADELTSPVSTVPAWFHRDGRLHQLPTGTVLGIPTDLEALAASGLVSAEGVARAAEDLTLPATEITDDLSVGAYFRARLGDEVTERLIDPMIGGINASDIDHLALASAAPQVAAAAASHRSIIEGLRASRAKVGATLGSAGADQPVFHGLPGGIARIIDALVDALPDGKVHLESPVSALADLDADGFVLATPAPTTARLVRPLSPEAADALAGIPYASVAQVTVEFTRSAIDDPTGILDASGILFPRVDGKIITAATFFSSKWDHYRRDDTVLIRMTSGRYRDSRALDLDDEGLTARLLGDLGSVLTITGRPNAVRVHRWLDAFPQYQPGHDRRIAQIEAAVRRDAPTVHLAGAAYHGIGIPACIRSGRTAAGAIVTPS